MIRTFLKAKHWQLFIITFGIPMFIQTFMSNMMINKMGQNPYNFNDTPEIAPDFIMETMVSYLINFMQIISIVMVFVSLVMYGWYWAVGVGLQEKIPENAKMNLAKFKFFYSISLIYSLFFVGLMGFAATYIPALISGTMPISTLTSWLSPFLLTSLLAMFSMFYCMYFVAKTIKTIELQAEPTFSSFFGEFLMVWFFFIGVWMLQPKINAFVEEKIEGSDDMDWLDDA